MQDKCVSPKVGLAYCPAETGSPGKDYLLSWEDCTAGSWRRRWLEFPAQSKEEGEITQREKASHLYTEYKKNHAQKNTREDRGENKHSELLTWDSPHTQYPRYKTSALMDIS